MSLELQFSEQVQGAEQVEGVIVDFGDLLLCLFYYL